MRLWVLAAATTSLLLGAASAERDPVLVAKAVKALGAARAEARARGRREAAGVEPRIFRGNNADFKQFPNAALAVIMNRACTATIVHERFVLLSSWCTAGRDEGGLVIAGNVNLNHYYDITYPVTQVRMIMRWWMYPWVFRRWHDITVAQLFVPFVFNGYVEVLPMTDWETFPNGSVHCTMVGFGEQFNWDVRHQLHYALIDVEDYSACEKGTGAFNSPIGRNAMCTKDTMDSSICDGDAGGPVMCLGSLTGTISDLVLQYDSVIRNCSFYATSNYFMFIGYYRKWIEGIIANHSKPAQRRVVGAVQGRAPAPTPSAGGLLLCVLLCCSQ